MNTTNEIPTVEQTVAAIKREILADIGTAVSSSGQVMPATVSTFSELHDYVDANTYGGMCDTLADLMDSFQSDEANEAWMVHCNKATDIVDAWLRAGRPTEDCWESTHSHCGAHDAPWQPFADTCDGA